MPTVRPADIRAMVQQLAQDGVVDRSDVDKLVDAALSDETLSRSERKGLVDVLRSYGDKLDSATTRTRLESFLAISSKGVRNLAHTLERDDGVIGVADAQKLVDLTKADGRVSGNEKYSLRAVMVGAKLAAGAKEKLDEVVSGTTPQPPTPPAGPAVSMGNTDAGRAVFLSAQGFFVEDAALDKPRTAAELGTGLFRMAELVDDAKTNPFTQGNLPLAARQQALTNVLDAMAQVKPGATLPAGLDANQALQLRSSCATVLLAIASSAKGDATELPLKQAAFDAYKGALDVETQPMLRDSMVFNLHNQRASLTPAMQAITAKAMQETAPLSPPYEEWFKNGNNTLNVFWASGEGSEGFYAGTVNMLKNKGFAPEGTERDGGPCVYAKSFTARDGREVKVRLTCHTNNSDIFAKMSDPKFNIVGYDGHSDLGRAVPESLDNAPDGVGKKLIFTGLCAGKDNIHAVRDRFPDAQMLTTFTSSYFNTEDLPGGGKRMNRSENFNTLMVLLEGAVEKKPWEAINKDIREKAILFPWSHVMPGGTNYISPIHTEIRRRVLDSDHDGQADVLDKLYSVDTNKVKADTAREFTPIDAGRPADVLDGTRVHLAAMALNTATGYNQVTQDYKKGSIVGAGYFEPKAGEQEIVKFERATVDGDDVLFMKVNARYAHMSVEGLRAAAHYAFIQEIAKDADFPITDPADKKLMGLVLAAFSIMYDRAYVSRDEPIWKGLLQAYNLPATIPIAPIGALLDEEHHDYSGNIGHVDSWKSKIPAAALAALAKPETGVPA